MDTTAIVTGASRGFGRAVATALIESGATVVGVARGRGDLAATAAALGEAFRPVVGDATDPDLARALIAEHQPGTLVLGAGAIPINRPVHRHTWETLSTHWHTDVRHVFEWTRAALLAPLPPGSRVVALSSGAAVHGSPVSGGYAGAKATIRFLSAYAAAEAERDGLGISFGCLLPNMSPAAGVGASGAAGYADRAGVDLPTFLARMGPTVTPDQVADAVLTVAPKGGAWLLTPDGLTPAA